MSSLNILLIEDDAALQEVLAEMLDYIGDYAVQNAFSGEQALEIIKENPPELVLMDIGLQGKIDGIQTAKSITDFIDIPIIYITGASDRQTIERAKLTSPYGYLIKPIDTTELRATIEIALNKHRYEKQIKKHEQLLSTTLNSISDGVITTNRQGQITYFNRAAEQITGWTYPEVLDKDAITVLALFQEEGNNNQDNYSNSISKDYFAGGSAGNHFTMRTKNQEKIPVEVSSSPVLNDKKQETGKVFVFRDITARKEAESKLQAYQEKLRSLASSLSLIEDTQRREFATQLHESIGQMLAMSKVKMANTATSELDEEVRSVFDEVYQLIDKSLQIIRSLTSEISPPALYEIGLEAGIQWLLDKVTDEYDIQATFDKPKEPVSLDKNIRITLFSAIRELVYNAAEHAQATRLNLTLSKDSQSIMIRVSDNGVGFDAERVLEEMDTSERLGLFNIRERIEYLQGKFEIDSVAGEGTTGMITIPFQDDV